MTKPGGLHRARQQSEAATALGIYSDIGGSIEMGIGNAANLQLGAALESATLPSVCPVTSVKGGSGPEVAGVYYLDDIVTESFRFEDGCVLVPEGPGLGIEVDVEKLRHYSSPMRVAVLGAGAIGWAAAAELAAGGHEVRLWGRSRATLEPLDRGGRGSPRRRARQRNHRAGRESATI